MRRIGLITGLGPVSSVDYYLGIINGFRERKSTSHYPEICMFNVDMERMFQYANAKDYESVAMYFAESITRLQRSGASAAAICCNTLHIAFDFLLPKSALPLISIVDTTCDEILRKGYKKVLLLGTKFTMDSDLYTKPLCARGIDVAVPDPTSRQRVHSIIFPRLEEGIVDDIDKKELLQIANDIILSQQSDAVILGCTELPLMIKAGDLPVPLVNTLDVHVNAILDYLLKDSTSL